MDSPQIRVKLSSAEVEGSPRVDLDFGVKEENVSERERGAIFRTSLGEARHVRPSDPLSLSIYLRVHPRHLVRRSFDSSRKGYGRRPREKSPLLEARAASLR